MEMYFVVIENTVNIKRGQAVEIVVYKLEVEYA